MRNLQRQLIRVTVMFLEITLLYTQLFCYRHGEKLCKCTIIVYMLKTLNLTLQQYLYNCS